MPEFTPGEQKVATVVMTNPTTAAFNYEGIIYMGTNLSIVSQVSFSLSAGEQKNVSFPVTMPATPGVYPVYIGVSSGGVNIALYRSTEDVVISQPVITRHTLTVLDAPTQIFSGTPMVVRFQLDIPAEGLIHDLYFRLKGPEEGPTEIYGQIPDGRIIFDK